MISELNDEQILDLLMTSEFEVDLSPSEFKFLLKKWRYFYRILHGRMQRVSEDLKFEIKKKDGEILNLKQENYKILVEKTDQENIIHLLKNRKLSFKERWTGKIIQSDENK